MGFFTQQKGSFPWNTLSDNEDFLKLWESTDTFLIFKHSTRCPISSMALRKFENSFSKFDNCQLYLLDLLQHREISNKIADITSVFHQSPQVILIKNKNILYHASHENISSDEIEKLL